MTTPAQLHELETSLLQEARSHSSGRATHVVTGGHDKVLRQLVVALASGASLSEHENPGEATLQVLRGDVRLASASADLELTGGDLATVPAERHSLRATTDAVVLLTLVHR